MTFGGKYWKFLNGGLNKIGVYWIIGWFVREDVSYCVLRGVIVSVSSFGGLFFFFMRRN